MRYRRCEALCAVAMVLPLLECPIARGMTQDRPETLTASASGLDFSASGHSNSGRTMATAKRPHRCFAISRCIQLP